MNDTGMTQHPHWVAWNLFLAFVPVALAWAVYALMSKSKENRALKLPAAVLGLMWLAFLPNTCYLLTEWRHFLFGLDASNLYLQSQFFVGARLKLMIYTAYYFCYSGAGMLAFTLAIRPMAKLAKQHGATMWVHGLWLFQLCSLGVYLGLKPRFNSWDFVARPNEIWAFVLEIAHHPFLSAFIVAFGCFLWLSYIAIDILIDGFKARMGMKPQ